MKQHSENNNNGIFYLFVIGFFLIIVSKGILAEGMFMDGLFYSTIAHNLSNGIGTFFTPHFSQTCHPHFHEHPPLAFGLQSLFFSLFGNSYVVDKLYSCFTFLVLGYVVVKIWENLNLKNAWVPLLLLLSTPLSIWAVGNNLLENTLSVFTSLSVLFYLKSLSHKKYLFLFLSGLMLSLGFLTKGFVTFFPLVFPFCWWFMIKKNHWLDMLKQSSLLLLFSIAPLVFLFALFPEAKWNIQKYINRQVINSIANISTVDSRFFIVKSLFLQLIPALGLFSIASIIALQNNFKLQFLKSSLNQALVFFMLGFSGVLPIMISMKQREFYLFPALPFFALGLGILINPVVNSLLCKINYTSIRFLYFKWLSVLIFAAGILLSVYHAQYIERDVNKIKDTHKILSVLPQGSIINIHQNMYEDWSLHAYYARYKNVSLKPLKEMEIEKRYLLLHKQYFNKTIYNKYNSIPLQTSDYFLFQKK